MKTSRAIKYTLFAFCYFFWVASALLIAVGIYAKLAKEGGIVDLLTTDPALMLIVIGSLMFVITFFGCLGALRDTSILLKIFAGIMAVVLILQITAAVLGFIFSDLVMERSEALVKRGISTYRNDLDLDNLIDFIQKKFQCCGSKSLRDWSANVYFHCDTSNPSLERCGVPFSCCIPEKEETVINTMCGYGVQSQRDWDLIDKIYVEGCLDKVVVWGRQNLLALGGITLGLFVLEIFMIVLASVQISQLTLISNEKKRKSLRYTSR
ncbi:tetraspanin-33 isoform X1 [Polypterus senegalus]|uniref:tetraspanin-33 isoform X1 n=1 Tax=Polypterus senegalus TaxID=55291 RepID=UPI001964E683|nr:tetraspanin-33 isoform X1 [Polypterus senegalus]